MNTKPFRRLGEALLVAMVVSGAARAESGTREIVLPQSSAHPESLTSTADGTLYAGSMTNGGIVKVEPGTWEARTWIEPGAFGTRSIFGLLADDRSGKLWVCSSDATPLGVAGPTRTEGAFVKRFDLATGAGEFSARLPSTPSLCNDMAIGPDRALYVTNSLLPQILRLKENATEFEVWVEDERLKGGLDGLAFGQDGSLYANTFVGGELFRIAANDGKAGTITKLELSRPLHFPDGLRADGSGFLLAEGAGPLSRVSVSGNRAAIETIGEFAGPSGVTRVGDTVWVAEGQIASLLDPSKKAQAIDFRLRPVELPAP